MSAKTYMAAGRWLLILLALFMMAAGIWHALTWYLAPTTFQEKKDLVQSFAQLMGGTILFFGLIFTWRNIRATERNIKNTQETTLRNLEIAQEGQVTQRFSKAIEQLGSDRLEIRLGGIYALERIAKESEKDLWPIVEILTAFVRENAPRSESEPTEGRRLPTDIQAIITVLGRRKTTSVLPSGAVGKVNLSNTELRKGNLFEANFADANFYHSCLEDCFMEKAHLERADLLFANLKGARLDKASLLSADIRQACLESAHLNWANLSRASLSHANLRGAYLVGATLIGAYLMHTDFTGAVLEAAVLTDADLMNAVLEGGDLTNARLSNTNLSGANLKDANIEGADLSEARGLSWEQIRDTYGYGKARLPARIQEIVKSEEAKRHT